MLDERLQGLYNGNMSSQFERSELLLGENSTNILNGKKVLVFGIGGVGGFVVEGLSRMGIGEFLLVDNDTVNVTNINRQIIALHSTLGKFKTKVMKERVLDINPNAIVSTKEIFFLPENSLEIDFSHFDYVVDCIDTITSKIHIAQICDENNIPLISSMGTGNKLNPTSFVVDDIFNTEVCPLAKVMRRELKKRNIHKLKVVYSKEQPKIQTSNIAESGKRQRPTTSSVSFVPSVAGLIIASEIIKDLLK